MPRTPITCSITLELGKTNRYNTGPFVLYSFVYNNNMSLRVSQLFNDRGTESSNYRYYRNHFNSYTSSSYRTTTTETWYLLRRVDCYSHLVAGGGSAHEPWVLFLWTNCQFQINHDVCTLLRHTVRESYGGDIKDNYCTEIIILICCA